MPTRVLIVDDHASFRRLAARMLRESGFDVIGEAADAASALDAARALEPDVVLLDVVLPDRSGLSVAAELARGTTRPRVVLTSSRSRSDFDPALEWPPECEFVPKHDLSGAGLRALVDRP
jgi:DNA-binding NarL/FixJ family response regulator